MIRSLVVSFVLMMLALQAAEQPLRIVHTAGYAPYEFVNEDGAPQGYLIDVFQLWSRKTGTPVVFEQRSWSECLKAVREGHADVITGMTPTNERRVDFAFAREIARAESRVFMHRSLTRPDALNDLAGLVVGVVAGDNSETLLRAQAPDAQVRTYPGYRELAEAAKRHEIKAALGTSAVLYHQLSALNALGEFTISDFSLNDDPMAPAVLRGRDEQVAALNDGFDQFTQEEWDSIARLWVPYTLEPNLLPWGSVLRWGSLALGVALLVVMGLMSWNWQMRRRVNAALAAQRTLEGDLRQAQKMDALGQLAGGVAHDFNNLLTAILGQAELIKMKAEDEAGVRSSAGNIAEACRTAGDLVRQLLRFARRAVDEREPVDLHAMLEQTCDLLARSLGSGVEIQREMAATKPVVLGDASLLQAAVMNLATNARDAMNAQGCLRVTTHDTDLPADAARLIHPDLKAGRYCELRVIDTGGGMDDDTMQHIFEPFFTTKEAGKGTGLGLAMVYGTVREHGGAIVCESQPGVGTTFRAWLPLAG
ncbi:MAG: transporter substrate-binding domain-containing protein [Planctomycetota bacterium]|nr:transporter substrate-binding domain-containing protein [Planctomycetota bacterium]